MKISFLIFSYSRISFAHSKVFPALSVKYKYTMELNINNSKGKNLDFLLQGKTILDACCSSRMFHFDKENPEVLFMDIRSEDILCSDGRKIKVRPDLVADFTNMPFKDDFFKLVIFDPPHDMYAGKNSYTSQKYGNLNKNNWQQDLKKGFDECIRVLEPKGLLIFKWNEMRISTNNILNLFEYQPLIGHKSGKNSKTHWITFVKTDQQQKHVSQQKLSL